MKRDKIKIQNDKMERYYSKLEKITNSLVKKFVLYEFKNVLDNYKGTYKEWEYYMDKYMEVALR